MQSRRLKGLVTVDEDKGGCCIMPWLVNDRETLAIYGIFGLLDEISNDKIKSENLIKRG